MASRKEYKILVLPGDHCGPEVTSAALKVLQTLQTHPRISRTTAFTLDTDLCGGCSIDLHGTPVTSSVLNKASLCDAILFGSVGGPEWGTTYPNPESGLLRLRTEINAFANLRPCRIYAGSLMDRSPLKEDVVKGTDFVVVRENCGGAYYGPKVEDYDAGIASDTWGYSVPEIQRVARVAGALARQMIDPLTGRTDVRVTSTDKANVLANSRLWRKVVTETFATEFADVELRHQLADSLSMLMMTRPRQFNGVILADNTFGDMLSDQAGGVVGTLGTLPSASLCGVPEKGLPVKGLYEPVHGSAPDIAGKGIVNPTAAILSLALMLRYSFCMYEEADAVEAAVEKVLDSKERGGLEIRTADLGGKARTEEVGDAVCRVLKEILDKEAAGVNGMAK